MLGKTIYLLAYWNEIWHCIICEGACYIEIQQLLSSIVSQSSSLSYTFFMLLSSNTMVVVSKHVISVEEFEIDFSLSQTYINTCRYQSTHMSLLSLEGSTDCSKSGRDHTEHSRQKGLYNHRFCDDEVATWHVLKSE